jgi:hypothetical protein
MLVLISNTSWIFVALSPSRMSLEMTYYFIERSFELKLALINMVQASQFCGKAQEDASAHLQHFLDICSTFTIKDVPRDDILLRLFPFSLLGRAKQRFYATKEKNTTWTLCSPIS